MSGSLRDWNMNTLIQAATLATLVFAGGKMWSDVNAANQGQDNTIAEMQGDLATISASLAVLTKETTEFAAWRTAHEKTGTDRRGIVEGNIATVTAQVRELDGRLDKAEVSIDRSLQAVAGLDRISQSASGDFASLRQQISDLSGRLGIAIAFIEEIRTDRIDASRQGGRK